MFTIPNLQSNPSFDAQAFPDETDWTAIALTGAGTGIGGGCSPTQHTGSDMEVSLTSGTVFVADTQYVYAGGTVTIGAASPTDRRDIVVYTAGTGMVVVAGTPCEIASWNRTDYAVAPPPVKPAIPSNSALVCEVYVEAGVTAVTGADIIDKRLAAATGGGGGGGIPAPGSPVLGDTLEFNATAWINAAEKFNVIVFGADPTGSQLTATATTAAINAAYLAAANSVTGKGCVVFPPGNYVYNGPMIVYTNTATICSGMGVAVLSAATGYLGESLVGYSAYGNGFGNPAAADSYQLVQSVTVNPTNVPVPGAPNLNTYRQTWIGSSTIQGPWPLSGSTTANMSSTAAASITTLTVTSNASFPNISMITVATSVGVATYVATQPASGSTTLLVQFVSQTGGAGNVTTGAVAVLGVPVYGDIHTNNWRGQLTGWNGPGGTAGTAGGGYYYSGGTYWAYTGTVPTAIPTTGSPAAPLIATDVYPPSTLLGVFPCVGGSNQNFTNYEGSTIAASSLNGSATFVVAASSTAGFPTGAGSFVVDTTTGLATVAYTSFTGGTTFHGCQVTTGSGNILGPVTTPSGAVIPGANVWNPSFTGHTMVKNNWVQPMCGQGAGLRFQANRVFLDRVLVAKCGGDAFVVQNDVNGDAGDINAWNIVADQPGGYGFANYNVSDSKGGHFTTNGCGLGGVFVYASDWECGFLHLTNGPSSSVFTPAFISGGNHNQQVGFFACDSQYGGAIYVDNARHSGTATQNMKVVSVQDLLGQNNNWINFSDPFVSMASTGGIQAFNLMLAQSSIGRCAQAASAPAATIYNTITSPSGSILYFVSLLPFIISFDGTTATAQVTALSGAVKQWPTTAFASTQCAMAIGAGTMRAAGSGGTIHQDITLTARALDYNFYSDIVPILPGTVGTTTVGSQSTSTLSGTLNLASAGQKAIPTTEGVVSVPTTGGTSPALIYYSGVTPGSSAALTGCVVLSGSGTIAASTAVTPCAMVLAPDTVTNNPVPFFITSITYDSNNNPTALHGVWGTNSLVSGSASFKNAQISQCAQVFKSGQGDAGDTVVGVATQITGVTLSTGTPTITTSLDHGWLVGQEVTTPGIGGMTDTLTSASPSGPYLITAATATTLTLSATWSGTYTAATGSVIGPGGAITIATQTAFQPTQTDLHFTAWQTSLVPNPVYVFNPATDAWEWGTSSRSPQGSNSLIGGGVTTPTIPPASSVFTVASCVLNATNVVTSSAAFGSVTIGMGVTGTDIPANTYVTEITSTSSITLNNAATGSPTETLTFYEVVTNTTGYPCDVYVYAGADPVSVYVGLTEVITVPASTSLLVAHLAAGQTIALSYTGGTSTWLWVGT